MRSLEFEASDRVDNPSMGRVRAVGLVALLGFLAITAWSAGLVPSSCCSASCERCPTTFCKGTDANPCPKMPVVSVSGNAGVLVDLAVRSQGLLLGRAPSISFQRPGFSPPMRN